MRIIGFGDSITEGTDYFAPHLANILYTAYGRKVVDMVNAGVGGNTTVNALARIQADVINKSPDMVIVNFGTNDAYKDDGISPRVPLSTYQSNIASIFNQIQTAGAVVVWMNSIPCNEAVTSPNLLNADKQSYNTAAKVEADARGITTVDVYGQLMNGDYTISSLLNSDGIHPAITAVNILAETVFGTMLTDLKKAFMQASIRQSLISNGSLSNLVNPLGWGGAGSTIQNIVVQPRTAYVLSHDGVGQIKYKSLPSNEEKTLEGKATIIRTSNITTTITLTTVGNVNKSSVTFKKL